MKNLRLRGPVVSGSWCLRGVLLLALSCAWPLVRSADAAQDAHAPGIEAALAALLEEFDAPVRTAALAIPRLDRRLLAVRGYVRAGTTLAARWSWTDAQAHAFAASAPGHALAASIDQVRCVFRQRHPGHDLFVNPQFRSLEIQLQRWNANDSVGAAARNLLQAALPALDARLREAAAPDAARALRDWLANHVPSPQPTLAVPGLSSHGQARAVDFQVMREGRVIAGTSAAAIATQWESTGWKRHLADAVTRSGEPFEGPLRTPHEPWHYQYGARPAGASAAAAPACTAD